MSPKNGMGSRKRRKTRTGRLDMGNAEAVDEMDDLDTEGPVAILWDIENCPIPVGVPPMDVSGNVRNSLMVHGGVKGGITTFSAYGDYSRLSKEIRRGCQNTGINLIDVPSGYKDAADKAILIDMFLFALDNRPPALILLISGDVDFAPALHKLRQRGYTIAVALPRVRVHSALSNAGNFVWDWHNMASNKSLGSISRFNLDIMAENLPNSSLNGGECQGHQPEPTNANDVDKQGLCSEEKIIDSKPPSQTEDINAFKDEIVRVVSMNGGKLCLERIASSYEKAFGKKICLVKYGSRKLLPIIQEIGDLCIEGDGRKRSVYVKL